MARMKKPLKTKSRMILNHTSVDLSFSFILSSPTRFSRCFFSDCFCLALHVRRISRLRTHRPARTGIYQALNFGASVSVVLGVGLGPDAVLDRSRADHPACRPRALSPENCAAAGVRLPGARFSHAAQRASEPIMHWTREAGQAPERLAVQTRVRWVQAQPRVLLLRGPDRALASR